MVAVYQRHFLFPLALYNINTQCHVNPHPEFTARMMSGQHSQAFYVWPAVDLATEHDRDLQLVGGFSHTITVPRSMFSSTS